MTPQELRVRLEEMAGEHAPPVTNLAQVSSVDEQAMTCVLVDEDGQEFLDVRLRPVLTGNASFAMIPKVGAQVMAVRIEDDDDWMVIACDEFTKVSFTIGELSFVLDESGRLVKGDVKIELGPEITIEKGAAKVTVADQITVEKGTAKIVVSDKIKLEAGGANMGALIASLFDAIAAMSFVVPGAGNTTTLNNLAQFQAIKSQFNNLLN